MTAVRRSLVAVGGLVLAYAVIGALGDADVKAGALFFLAGVLVAHDGLLLPLTIVAGVILRRYAPPRLRPALQAALVISLAVTVVAFPLVLGRGRSADNPSLLPLHYGRGLLAIYAIIWSAALATVATRSWRERRRRPQPPPG